MSSLILSHCFYFCQTQTFNSEMNRIESNQRSKLGNRWVWVTHFPIYSNLCVHCTVHNTHCILSAVSHFVRKVCLWWRWHDKRASMHVWVRHIRSVGFVTEKIMQSDTHTHARTAVIVQFYQTMHMRQLFLLFVVKLFFSFSALI